MLLFPLLPSVSLRVLCLRQAGVILLAKYCTGIQGAAAAAKSCLVSGVPSEF